MWSDQVSRVSRATPRKRVVDPLEWLPEKRYWSGLDEAKIIVVLFETFVAILYSLSHR
jgi:hypothetical protein